MASSDWLRHRIDIGADPGGSTRSLVVLSGRATRILSRNAFPGPQISGQRGGGNHPGREKGGGGWFAKDRGRVGTLPSCNGGDPFEAWTI